MSGIHFTSNIIRTLRYMRRNGVINAYYAAKERMELNAEGYEYVPCDDAELAKQRTETDDVEGWPSIALVMPAYNTPGIYLKEAVDSVIRQTYRNWQLVICDSSDNDSVASVIKTYEHDERIHYIRLVENKGISENTNAGIAYLLDDLTIEDSGQTTHEQDTSGENGSKKHTPDYIGFLDHDDVLTPDALYRMARAINNNIYLRPAKTVNKAENLRDTENNDRNKSEITQDIDGDSTGQYHISENPGNTPLYQKPALLYSDEDKMCAGDNGADTVWFDPHRKYDFNYDLLLTNNYICHLMLVRSDILRSVRFRSGYDGAQDYDLVLQTVRYITEVSRTGTDARQNSEGSFGNAPDPGIISRLHEQIIHVPYVLYHWRSHPGSTANNTKSKTYAYEAGLKAVTDHVLWIAKTAMKCISVTEAVKNDPVSEYDDRTQSYRIAFTLKDRSYDIRVSNSKHLGFYEVHWDSIDDLFAIRPEVGAVIGRVTDKKGRMTQCIADRDGKWLYAGLNRHYAGAFNRFDCAQDVYMADPKHLKVRPELEHLRKDCTDHRKLAIALENLGRLILYLPTERI